MGKYSSTSYNIRTKTGSTKSKNSLIDKSLREMELEEELPPKPQLKLPAEPPKKKGFAWLATLGMVGAVSLAGFFGYNYYLLKKNPNMLAEKEDSVLVAGISKFMELPDETPIIASVTDKEKLKEQVFFKSAENGDKVLIYTQAEKAILYRPSTKKIIEVAPIYKNDKDQNAAAPSSEASGAGEQQQADSKEKNQQVTVAIYNGTKIPGLAEQTEQKIKERYKDAMVVVKQNAAKQDYKKTVITNLGNVPKESFDKLVSAVEGNEGDLPEGERKPQADVLVILGGGEEKKKEDKD